MQMKKTNNKSKKKIPIKALAEQFSHELDAKLPVHVLPNGDIAYKQYRIRQTKNSNWAIYDSKNNSRIDQFFLKSCALMAAKAYNSTKLERYSEVKQLDNRYWANYCDHLVFKKNIQKAKDFDHYLILLTRLEDSEAKVKYYKDAISRMFAWSFV